MFIFPSLVLAVDQQQIHSQQKTQDSSTANNPSSTPIKVQNQIQIQNQGTKEQLRVTTQEKTNAGTDSGKLGQPKTVTPKAQAQENMSVVAQKVQELLSLPERSGGIGEQVRIIAQAQNQIQQQMQQQLNKIESRKGLVKALFGPDYGAIKNLKQQLEQNQLRVRQLGQLVNQLSNPADQNLVQETIEALNQQNVALQEKIAAEERVGSAFGWLLKLFTQ